MANTKSAAKQARAAIRKRAQNRTLKDKARTLEKQFRGLVAAGKQEEAQSLLPKVSSALDKSAKRKAIHTNKASRKNARLAKLLKPKAA